MTMVSMSKACCTSLYATYKPYLCSSRCHVTTSHGTSRFQSAYHKLTGHLDNVLSTHPAYLAYTTLKLPPLLRLFTVLLIPSHGQYDSCPVSRD